MSFLKFWRHGRVGQIVGTLVIVAILIGGVLGGMAATASTAQKHLTAYFSQTVGLYVGNAVDVMGVQIGKITSLTVEGSKVKADISYDASQKLPANVKAVLVTPSIVSDRYIEMTPVYRSGAVLGDNQVIGENRTAVPIEFDDIFKNLDKLNQALGPNGANKGGALSRLINISDENLHGNGKELNSALKNFTGAISTLSGNRGNLFKTVDHLQQFTTTLANDDGGVRALNKNLEQVGAQLAGERHDLGAALSNLSSALHIVSGFVASNRAALTHDVHGATQVSRSLEAEKTAIAQIVSDAPIAVENLALAGDSKAHTLDTKASLSYGVTPTALCNSVVQILKGVPSLGGVLGNSGLCKAVKGPPGAAAPPSSNSSAGSLAQIVGRAGK